MFGIKKAIKDTQVKKLIQSVDYSISILQAQQAQMRAVKALTWKD